MSFDKTKHYLGFEIGLDEAGDGTWCACLCDEEDNLRDYGQVAAFVPYNVALEDAKITAEHIRKNPEEYA